MRRAEGDRRRRRKRELAQCHLVLERDVHLYAAKRDREPGLRVPFDDVAPPPLLLLVKPTAGHCGRERGVPLLDEKDGHLQEGMPRWPHDRRVEETVLVVRVASQRDTDTAEQRREQVREQVAIDHVVAVGVYPAEPEDD